MKKRLVLISLVFCTGCLSAAEEDPANEVTGLEGSENSTETETETTTIEEGEVETATDEEARENSSEESEESTDEETESETTEETGADGAVGLNEQFTVDAEYNLEQSVYALTGRPDGSVFVCGSDELLTVDKETGSSVVASASCDTLLLSDDTLYLNDRKSGVLLVLDTASTDDGSPEPTVIPALEGEPIRNMAVTGTGESSRIALACGDGGIAFFDPLTNEVDAASTIGNFAAMHVIGLPGTNLIVAGGRDSIKVFDITSGEEKSSMEVLSGSADMGWIEGTAEEGFTLSSINPLGLTAFTVSADGIIDEEGATTHVTGAHPFAIRNGVASLWSELATFTWSENDNGEQTLVLNGRFSKTYNTEGRTVNRHFVDVLDRDEGSVIAAHDSGVIWFELAEQPPSPDIHTDNLVLKMSPYEEGGPSSVLALLLNKGTATLEITEITIDNGVFTYTLDSPREEGAVGPLLSVEPGSSGYFEVAYPGGEKAEVGRITIKSNDPDEPEYSMTARVNHPNIEAGFALPSDLVPDAEGRLHALTDWEGKIKYAKLFNGL